MIRRPPRSTLFPYTNALPISDIAYEIICQTVNKQNNLPFGSIGRHQFNSELALVGRFQKVKSQPRRQDRKSTRLNSSHANISYAVFCLKKKTNDHQQLFSVY